MDECAICLDKLEDNKKRVIRVLGCKHIYHNQCVYEWSIKENSCPQCRTFFDFDTNNQEDFLEWMDLKLENFDQRYHTKKHKLLVLIEMVDTTLRLNKKGIKCSDKIYKAMLNKIREYKSELNYSWMRWLCNKMIFGEEHICEYGWYNKTIKQLKILNAISS